MDSRLFCLELVMDDEQGAGELAYTALAVGDDGTLYAARPLAGDVLALDDTDGDLLPDTPRIIASGLTLPNALAWHEGALYIAGGTQVHRWQDGTLQLLIDDVPSGGGYWVGGIAVEDDAIYVATGGETAYPTTQVENVTTNPLRGAILRYAPPSVSSVPLWFQSSILTTGLQQPGDLVWYRGTLWTNDSASIALADTPDLDEINRVTAGANFGFPACIDAMATPDCANVTLPAFALPTRSHPLGMAAYRGGALPALEGALLVVLAGNRNDARLRGFQVRALWFDDEGNFEREYALMPNGDDYADTRGQRFDHEQMTYRGSGMYPRHPFDVAVSPEGWVYISVSGGRIMVLRSR